jgi:hypothetical protein
VGSYNQFAFAEKLTDFKPGTISPTSGCSDGTNSAVKISRPLARHRTILVDPIWTRRPGLKKQGLAKPGRMKIIRVMLLSIF